MLLKYLLMRTGNVSLDELKYSNIWEEVLLCMSLDSDVCNMFSIHDWQETLLYFKGERLSSDNPRDYLHKLLT